MLHLTICHWQHCLSEAYIYKVICNIASTCELLEWSHTRQYFDSLGQNYFGVLIPVILRGKQYEKDVTLPLVLKLAPTDERYRVSGAVQLFFAREIFIYTEVFKLYHELQEKHSPDCQFIIPECYFVCKEYCKEVLAMENMCAKGYSPYTLNVFLDLDHVVTALKAVAKFHALSFILKEKDISMYEKASNTCVPLSKETNGRFFTILDNRLMKALLTFKNTICEPILAVLKEKCDYFVESAINRVKNVCISHGDLWKENILFKYKANKPISACIIDYQTTRMSTPAFDVLYLILTSVDTSLRHAHFRELIDTYYNTLSQCLFLSHLNAKEIYSRDNFEYDLSIVGPACLIIANTAIWLSSGLQQDGHVHSKNQAVTEEEKFLAVNQYKSIISGIIDDLTRYGYLEVTEFVNK